MAASLTRQARKQVLEQLAAESLAPTACTTIEEVGSTGVGALTIAFLILGVSTIVFITRVGSAKGQKVYYYCNVFICGFATMSYFAMLSGQGWTAVAGCRQFFYARYVDWSVTTPLLLLDLGLIAGADGALIAAVIGADCKLQLPHAPHTMQSPFSVCFCTLIFWKRCIRKGETNVKRLHARLSSERVSMQPSAE